MNKNVIRFIALIMFLAAGAQCRAALPDGTLQMKPFESGIPEKMDDWKMFPGDPGGDPFAIDYDDSSWAPANVGYSWNGLGSYYWFRKKFIVPASAVGRPIIFQVAVDDKGVAFADGVKLGEFWGSGKFVLTPSAEPGQEILIAVKGVNEGGVAAFTFAGYKILKSADLITIEKIISELRTLSSISSQNIEGWRFNSRGGKNPASPDKDDSKWDEVSSSYTWDGNEPVGWFRTKFTVPETVNGFPVGDGAIKLLFGAKEGADIYANGKKVQSISGGGEVTIPPGVKPGTEIVLAVKVNSITGYGSLRYAKVQADSILEVQKKAEALSSKMNLVSLLVEQLPESNPGIKTTLDKFYEIVKSRSGDSSLDDLKALLTAAEECISGLDEIMNRYPVFVKGPYLQNSQPDGMTIMWETSVPSDSVVYFGKTDLSSSVKDDEKKLIHEVVISGLDIETTYKYAAVSGSLASPEGTFKTSIKKDSPFKFAVWGDSRTDYVSHENVVDAMIKANPDIALNVGDVVSYGVHYDQWGREHFIPIRRLGQNVPTYISIGNHEYGGYGYGNRVEWFEKFVSHPAPNDYYYSFTYGNSFFLILNPQDEPGPFNVRPGTEQYDWMMKQFESDSYKNSTFHFVFFHEPPYSEGWSGGYYDGEAAIRANLVPLFEKYRVDFVFAGHTHDYERGRWPKEDGPYYIITGGGGASLDDTIFKDWEQIDIALFRYHYILVTIENRDLKFEAIAPDGEVFDVINIKK